MGRRREYNNIQLFLIKISACCVMVQFYCVIGGIAILIIGTIIGLICVMLGITSEKGY
ncbi:MAG TPA: hypothetical protein PKJ95_02285 [Atribacterota bacterium]|nr:hypothetical protein [Atribacterota bacterium]